MLIEEGVLGRGERITASEIGTILLIIHKPNSIIVFNLSFSCLLAHFGTFTDLNERFPYRQRYFAESRIQNAE